MNNSGVFTKEELKEVREKEIKREELFAKEEKLLSIKSRAIWIKEGDNNSKLFHNYANNRRNLNTISTIKNMNRVMVSSFNEKAEAGEELFKNLFKEPIRCNIQEILEVINLFTRMIDEEMNILLKAEVSKEELEKVVYSCQKGKSPDPDGLTIEFFQGFYDIVK